MSENRLVIFVRRFLPVAEHYSGDAFFVQQEGRRVATPLLLVLVVVELTDVARSLPHLISISSRILGRHL